MIIEFVLFIILFLLLLIIKFNIKGSKLEIDHNFLIILGFIYYWYLPFIAYETNNLEQSLLANYDFVLKFYERVSYEAKVWYLITSVLLILSFLLGEIIFRKQSHKWNLLKNNTIFLRHQFSYFLWISIIWHYISKIYVSSFV